MLRAVKGIVKPMPWIDPAQARDVEDTDVDPEIDVDEKHLQHQRKPEDGYRKPDEAE